MPWKKFQSSNNKHIHRRKHTHRTHTHTHIHQHHRTFWHSLCKHCHRTYVIKRTVFSLFPPILSWLFYSKLGQPGNILWIEIPLLSLVLILLSVILYNLMANSSGENTVFSSGSPYFKDCSVYWEYFRLFTLPTGTCACFISTLFQEEFEKESL